MTAQALTFFSLAMIYRRPRRHREFVARVLSRLTGACARSGTHRTSKHSTSTSTVKRLRISAGVHKRIRGRKGRTWGSSCAPVRRPGPKVAGSLPFRELFTTRISDVFGDNGMVPAVHQRAQNMFSSSFSRLLPLEIGKLR